MFLGDDFKHCFSLFPEHWENDPIRRLHEGPIFINNAIDMFIIIINLIFDYHDVDHCNYHVSACQLSVSVMFIHLSGVHHQYDFLVKEVLHHTEV